MFHLVSFFTLASGLTCPKYECGTSTSTTLECINHAITSGNDLYKLTPCELGLYCPFSEGKSTSCVEYPAYTRYPGEYCSVDIDCMSNSCIGFQCQGLNKNSQANCSTTADCDPGLFCDHVSKKCEEVVSLGDSCKADDECPNDNLCDLGFCTQMFSLDNEQQTNITWGYLAPLCSSGYAVQDKNVWNCTAAPHSEIPNKVQECPADGICKSKENVTRACECGYDGKSYCPLFEGDAQVVSMISAWKDLFKSSNFKCNGLNRWSYECFYAINPVAYENYLIWAINASLYLDGVWYKGVNATQCVKNTVLLDYANLQDDYELSLNNYAECPVYEPADDNSWPTNQCQYYSSNIYSNHPLSIYQSKACNSGYVCNGMDSKNGTCVQITTTLAYPGEYCTENTQCITNMCSSNRCKGILVNQSCDIDTKLCNPGLFCNKQNICEDVNKSPSCAGDAECNSTSTCVSGLCTKLFSLALGQLTQLEGQQTYGMAKSCMSGFGRLNETENKAYCEVAPVTSGSLLAKCYEGMTHNDSTNQYTEACACGLGGQGSFPLFLGDGNHLSKVMSSLKSLGSKTSCYNNQWTEACVKHSESLLTTYYEFYVNNMNLTNSARYHLANEATLKFYAADFYNAVKYLQDDDSSSSAANALVVLGLFYFLV